MTGATPDSIELAHEALIRTWPVLAAWVAEERETLIRVDRFEQALAQWREDQRALLEGVNLAAAEEVARQGHSVVQGGRCPPASRGQPADRDEAAAREREREQAVRISESLRLASEARTASQVEPETALLVAWEALLWDRNELSEAVFRDAQTGCPHLCRCSGPTPGGFVAADHGRLRSRWCGCLHRPTSMGDAVIWDTDGTLSGASPSPAPMTRRPPAFPGLRGTSHLP